MNSIESVNVHANIHEASEDGLKEIMEGAAKCTTLHDFDVSLNLGMNNCMEQLIRFISTPNKIRKLNISDL